MNTASEFLNQARKIVLRVISYHNRWLNWILLGYKALICPISHIHRIIGSEFKNRKKKIHII